MINPFSFRKVVPLLPLLALAGCGGGGASPNPPTSGPVTVENSLSRSDFFDSEDDRYYDIYVCDARFTGTAELEMSSNAVDSFLYVYRKDSGGDYDLIAENDDGGSGRDAALEFTVERGQTYRIVATSALPDERGDYELFFSEELGRPARVLPDTNRVTQSVKLPARAPKKATQ
jgi:hypothetical protein